MLSRLLEPVQADALLFIKCFWYFSFFFSLLICSRIDFLCSLLANYIYLQEWSNIVQWNLIHCSIRGTDPFQFFSLQIPNSFSLLDLFFCCSVYSNQRIIIFTSFCFCLLKNNVKLNEANLNSVFLNRLIITMQLVFQILTTSTTSTTIYHPHGLIQKEPHQIHSYPKFI